MRRFFRSTGFKIFSVVMAALILGSVAAAVTENASSPVTAAAATVFTPLQRLSSLLSTRLSGFFDHFRSSASLQQEVDRLKKELEEYRGQLVDYEQTKQKTELYEAFLELKEQNPDYEFVSCGIIGRDVSDAFGSFTVNRGSASGISVNDPVIYGSYLVGVVVSVMPTQCVVSTIFNPKVNVSAYEVRTREAGFVTTTNELSGEGRCCLEGLERATSVAPGGIVCTSGVGGIYPADLIIGTVEAVNDSTQDISSYAVIAPCAEIGDLKDIFVVTAFSGQGSAAQTQ